MIMVMMTRAWQRANASQMNNAMWSVASIAITYMPVRLPSSTLRGDVTNFALIFFLRILSNIIIASYIVASDGLLPINEIKLESILKNHILCVNFRIRIYLPVPIYLYSNWYDNYYTYSSIFTYCILYQT